MPITNAENISMNNIEGGDMVSIDYVYNLKDEIRQDCIKSLLKLFPKGMFVLNPDGNTFTYKGGFERWTQSYVELIRSKTTEVTAENVMQWIGPSYQLQKVIVNPLQTDALFVIDLFTGNVIAERSRELMSVISTLQRGDKLYFGSVLGYHF